jgi:hypothetical protein
MSLDPIHNTKTWQKGKGRSGPKTQTPLGMRVEQSLAQGEIANEPTQVNAQPSKPKEQVTSPVKQVIPKEFDGLSLQLKNSEIKSPGTALILINQHLRLSREVKSLRRFVRKFHDADRDRAVLLEQLAAARTLGSVTNILLTVGGLLAGLSTSFPFVPVGLTFLTFGLLLLGLSAFFSRKAQQ